MQDRLDDHDFRADDSAGTDAFDGPPEAEASDEATCNGQQAAGDGGCGSFDSGSASAQDDTTVGAVIGRPPEAKAFDEATCNGQQAAGDGGCGSFDSGSASAQDDTTVGAVIGRPPEAEASEIDAKTQKRIARLEGLRRWMLVLAPILMLGGYVTDRLPILYASAIPLAVALLVTYWIKHLEETK